MPRRGEWTGWHLCRRERGHSRGTGHQLPRQASSPEPEGGMSMPGIRTVVLAAQLSCTCFALGMSGSAMATMCTPPSPSSRLEWSHGPSAPPKFTAPAPINNTLSLAILHFTAQLRNLRGILLMGFSQTHVPAKQPALPSNPEMT